MALGAGVSIPELPVAIVLDLYGDSSGHSLYLEFRDATGERFYKSVLPVAWSGSMTSPTIGPGSVSR